MSKRIKLLLVVVAAIVFVPVNALPAFAQEEDECGLGDNITEPTLGDIFVNDNPSGPGKHASQAAHEEQPFGQAIDDRATECAQK